MASRNPVADGVDFFPSAPWAFRAGAELILRLDPQARSAWECAAGAHHGAHGLRDYFPKVYTSDAYDYGLGDTLYDFTSDAPPPFSADWIITNSPFGDNVEPFIRRAVARSRRGAAMFLRLGCLAGQARYRLFYEECGLTVVAPFAERVDLRKGCWDPEITSATDYAWFVFAKGRTRQRRGEARIIPIPPGTEARLTRPSDADFAVAA
jgi:hypothetical protein